MTNVQSWNCHDWAMLLDLAWGCFAGGYALAASNLKHWLLVSRPPPTTDRLDPQTTIWTSPQTSPTDLPLFCVTKRRNHRRNKSCQGKQNKPLPSSRSGSTTGPCTQQDSDLESEFFRVDSITHKWHHVNLTPCVTQTSTPFHGLLLQDQCMKHQCSQAVLSYSFG